MSRLVADLLDTSTIAVGALRLDPDWCDLELVIESAVSCVAGAGEVVEITVDRSVRRVWADHDRIEQVLVNLVDNAVRHGPPGSPVAVAASSGATAGTVAFTVTDSGPGFPDTLLDRVLEPYTRGGNGRAGAGLGLAICRGIVEAHGGTISVANADGHGRVRVELPAEPAAPAPAAVAPEHDHAGL